MRTEEEVVARHAEIEAQPFPDTMSALLDLAAQRFGPRECFNYFEQGERLTFAELKQQVDRLAGALHRIGVRKGAHMAVMAPNLPVWPITWFALAKLGAVLVPVNNRYTARELRYVLEDAEADFLLLHNDYFPILDALGLLPPKLSRERIITLGARRAGSPHHWPELLARGPARFAGPEPIGPDDLLNIQYTSGTTGFPKGCMLTQRYFTLAGHVMRSLAEYRVTRILCAQFFHYIDPQFYIVLALYSGAAVYFADRLRASRFMPWVREHAIDFVFLFEPIFKQPEHPADGDNQLRLACLFGLTPRNHAPLEARFDTTAREWYGMTEIGAGLYMPMDRADMVGSGSCGIPAPFRETRICDPATQRPVVQGEIGELWVRGPGLMVGYYAKPEANAESFCEGWFRTGDLFRQDEKGFHYIVGRRKDMIRRSAENIAAREVEAVLRTHPAIREAAVVPVPDDYRGEEVKAYVQLMPGKSREDTPPEAILGHCAENLASFKVPRYLEYRDAFFYGPTDRVEKHRLIAESDDLRRSSYDRVDDVWR